ncbi:MAG: acyltransferase [Hydrogenophaga sp.]|jgi:peptidoglycan/LPS O-acetylase OafA/YrhL|nr:acyltransferase [Hydrogenophaga sp.]
MTFHPILHGLRGLAAMTVLLYHWASTYPAAARAYSAVPFLGTEWDLFLFIGLGWNGVHWFFVLSGYLLASKLLHDLTTANARTIAAFWQRRFLRIYPAVWAQLTLLLPFTWLIGQAPDYAWRSVLANYLLWSDPLPGGVSFYNGVYWTLPLELSFYLLLPFVVLLQRRIGFWGVIGLALAITLGWRFGLHGLNGLGYTDMHPTHIRILLPGMLMVFMAGYAITQFPQHIGDRLRYTLLAVALLAYVGWHQALVALRTDLPKTHWFLLSWEVVLGLLIACIIALLLKPLAPWRWMGSRPLVWLGDMSFGIYLWHWPVLRLLRKVVPGPWNAVEGSFLALGVCLAITLPLAMLSYRFVEKPALDWIARRQRRASAAA